MATSQLVHCMVCGKEHKTIFLMFQGQVCSWKCWDELKWREILSNLGKDYYPMPEGAQLNKAKYDTDLNLKRLIDPVDGDKLND